MADIKIGQKFSAQAAKDKTTTSITNKTQANHTSLVQDAKGNVLLGAALNDSLRRFSALGKDYLADRPSLKPGEELTIVVPRFGKRIPDPKAGEIILKWMNYHRNAPFDARLYDISHENHNHTPDQLIHMTSFAHSIGLLPRASRQKLEDKAIDAIIDTAKGGKLTKELVVLAVELFPANFYVVRYIMKGIAMVAFNLPKDEEAALYQVMWDAVDADEDEVIEGLFAAGRASAKHQIRNAKKAKKAREAAENAKAKAKTEG